MLLLRLGGVGTYVQTRHIEPGLPLLDLSSDVWFLDRYVKQGLHWVSQDSKAVQSHIECVEDTEALRDALPRLRLISFVGDGSILPRWVNASPSVCSCIFNPAWQPFGMLHCNLQQDHDICSDDAFQAQAECRSYSLSGQPCAFICLHISNIQLGIWT